MVKPAVFGTLFEGSMEPEERHAFGAHFTSEADIQKVVLPTIVRPWRQRIADARTGRQLLDLREQMLRYRVLDPACGSGNFLYVAYRELKRLELELLEKIHDNFGGRTRELAGGSVAGQRRPVLRHRHQAVRRRAGQGHADDRQEAGAGRNARRGWRPANSTCPSTSPSATCRWTTSTPTSAATTPCSATGPRPTPSSATRRIWGRATSPRNTATTTPGEVHAAFPDVPKMADYCVYWFRRAQDALPDGGRAGLVAHQHHPAERDARGQPGLHRRQRRHDHRGRLHAGLERRGRGPCFHRQLDERRARTNQSGCSRNSATQRTVRGKWRNSSPSGHRSALASRSRALSE